MKYYFFRDIEHEGNLENEKTYHSSGIVDKVFNRKETPSGKDLSVTFLSPFECVITSAWRTYSQVELFEVQKNEWENANEFYKKIDAI